MVDIGNTSTITNLELGVIEVRLDAQHVDAFGERMATKLFVAISRRVHVANLSQHLLHQNLLAWLAAVLEDGTKLVF